VDRLKDKVALVTGAAMGIGRGVADLFAEEGATVIATDIVAPEEGASHFEHLDVTDEEGWRRVVELVEGRYGHLDVLVNNAGVIDYSPIDSLALSDWERVIGVDQTGVWLGMRAVVPAMRRAGGGSVINLSSAWGVVGGESVAAYQAAKGAVRSMSRNAAVTYATEGIRVNSVIPGWIHTPLAHAQPQHLNDAVIGGTPMQRGGDPRDIAFGCVYLASDESGYVTGSDLVIDGGLLAQ
jgi:NAD(P)-dependent dehydrogenase (short-subunit alcohol dehydrogenase family)